MIGHDYWDGLIDWIQKVMLEKEHNVSPEDMHLIKVVDTADEAVKHIEEFYKSHELRPNF